MKTLAARRVRHWLRCYVLPANRKAKMADTNKPLKQFRSGALSVGVWARRHNDEVFYNATPQRAYLDKKDTSGGSEGTWKYTDSFGRDDLPIVAALLNQAFSFIVAMEQKAHDSKAANEKLSDRREKNQ